MQVGRWSNVTSSGKKCLSPCNRQENSVEISYYKFPNKMFLHSEDVIPLIWKLDRLCYNDTFYGPKRPLLDAQYPKLCPLFDLVDLEGIDSAIGNIYQGLGLNDTALVVFKQELMTYASENLIKINAFIDSPYLSKFETDEVCFPPISQTSKHVPWARAG